MTSSVSFVYYCNMFHFHKLFLPLTRNNESDFNTTIKEWNEFANDETMKEKTFRFCWSEPDLKLEPNQFQWKIATFIIPLGVPTIWKLHLVFWKENISQSIKVMLLHWLGLFLKENKLPLHLYEVKY